MRSTACFVLLAALALLTTSEVRGKPQGKMAARDCAPDPSTCSEDSQSICSIDEKGALRTFKSVCEMESFNCLDNKYYSFLTDGHCL